MAGLFLFVLRDFARNLLRENRRIRISFWCLIWDTHPYFSSNKPTDYLKGYCGMLFLNFDPLTLSGFYPILMIHTYRNRKYAIIVSKTLLLCYRFGHGTNSFRFLFASTDRMVRSAKNYVSPEILLYWYHLKYQILEILTAYVTHMKSPWSSK